MAIWVGTHIENDVGDNGYISTLDLWNAYSGETVTRTKLDDGRLHLEGDGVGSDVLKYYGTIEILSITDREYSSSLWIKNIGKESVEMKWTAITGTYLPITESVYPGETKLVKIGTKGNGSGAAQIRFNMPSAASLMNIIVWDHMVELDRPFCSPFPGVCTEAAVIRSPIWGKSDLTYTPSDFGLDLSDDSWTIAIWGKAPEAQWKWLADPTLGFRYGTYLCIGNWWTTGKSSLLAVTGYSVENDVRLFAAEELTVHTLPADHVLTDPWDQWMMFVIKKDAVFDKLYLNTYTSTNGEISTCVDISDMDFTTYPIDDIIYVGQHNRSGTATYENNYFNGWMRDLIITKGIIPDSKLQEMFYTNMRISTGNIALSDLRETI